MVALASVPAYAKPAKSKKQAAVEKVPVEAEKPEPAPPEEPVELSPYEKMFAEKPHITGPASVDLGNESGIELPDGYILYEAAAAREILEAGGDSAIGVVAMVLKPGSTWGATISATTDGYVSDDDADELDASPLLESIKQGTIQQNAKRRALKVPELFVDAWTDKPAYHSDTHRLTWGIEAHDSTGKVVNYDTRKLGRNGFLSILVVDAPESIAAARAEVEPIIEHTYFRTGARYEDHREGDRDSGVGLRGLVLGLVGVAAAKKAGVLVLVLVFLKKAGIFIAGGFAAIWKWLTGRNKSVG